MTKADLIIFLFRDYDINKLENPSGNYSTTRLLKYLLDNFPEKLKIINSSKSPSIESLVAPDQKYNVFDLTRWFLNHKKIIVYFSHTNIKLKELIILRLLLPKAIFIMKMGGVAYFYYDKQRVSEKSPVLNGYYIRRFCSLISNLISCTDDGSLITRYSQKFNLDGKIYALPNGLPNYPPQGEEKSDGRIIISLISRLDTGKFVENHLSAFKLLKHKYKNVHLNIFGSGPLMDKLKKRVITWGITESVEFHGHKPIYSTAVLKSNIIWAGIGYNVFLESTALKKHFVGINYGNSEAQFKNVPYAHLVTIKNNNYPIEMPEGNIDYKSDVMNKYIERKIFESTCNIFDSRTKISNDTVEIEEYRNNFLSWDERIFREIDIINNLL